MPIILNRVLEGCSNTETIFLRSLQNGVDRDVRVAYIVRAVEMVNIMENLSSLKAYVFEKKDEVFSTFKAFTNKNARAVYWVSVVLMGVSGLADALLLSSTVFSKNFLLFTAFLVIGLFLYSSCVKIASSDFFSLLGHLCWIFYSAPALPEHLRDAIVFAKRRFF